jgi:hypothetical protein
MGVCGGLKVYVERRACSRVRDMEQVREDVAMQVEWEGIDVRPVSIDRTGFDEEFLWFDPVR